MNTGTRADALFDYDVVDSGGNKIGSVDGVWVDDATERAEFIAVKTGWLFGQDHVLPIDQAQIDNQNQTIQIPYSQNQVKNGPSFGLDSNLSASDEQQIYDYYGSQRSTQTTPTGYAAGTGPTASTSGTEIPSPPSEQDLTLSEEELEVGKRTVQAGDVRLRKVVRTEHQEVPVELRREDIEIERVPASEAAAPENAFQEREIDIPLMEEQPVVAKEAHVTGGVRVSKDVETRTQTVGGDVRSEDVDIEGDDENIAGNSDLTPES